MAPGRAFRLCRQGAGIRVALERNRTAPVLVGHLLDEHVFRDLVLHCEAHEHVPRNRKAANLAG